MKTTFGKILAAKDALHSLSQEKLPVGEAVALARLIRRLDEELRIFGEQRGKLLEEYGETTADGGVEIAPEKRADFETELKALLDVAVEFDGDKLSITPQRISAAGILATEDFIDYQEEGN